jgi:hypothetical protein
MLHVFLNPDGSQDPGLVVIVQHPTGVMYSHQCGGHATLMRQLEGFLLPLGEAVHAQALFDWYWQEFQGHAYPPLIDWTEHRTQALGSLVGTIPCWLTLESGDDRREFLQLDETRMEECLEGWIPVLTPYGKGILVVKTSD